MTRYLVKTSFISLSVSNMNQYFFFLFLLHFFRSIKFSAYFSKRNEKDDRRAAQHAKEMCCYFFICLCYSELIVKSVAKFNLIRLFYPNERATIALTNLLQSMQNNVHKYRTGTFSLSLSLSLTHTHTHTTTAEKKKPIRLRQKKPSERKNNKNGEFSVP